MKTKLFYLMLLMVMYLPIMAENNSLPKDSSNNCTAFFTYSTDSMQTISYQFYGEATGTAPFQYHWNFGDGNNSNLQNPVHSFNSQGSFYVCLTISTSDSCSSTYCALVGVDSTTHSDCQAMFYAVPDSNANANTYHFMDASLGNINSWSWNFGDGGNSSEQNPIHTFNQNGTFNVCLTVSNTDSGMVVCNNTYCQNITIGNPSATFVLSGQVTADNSPVDLGSVNVYAADSGYVFINTTIIDSMGHYYFVLPEGQYIVRAELSPNSIYYGHYAPTYHINALNWQQATVISLTNSIFNANVSMIRIDSFPGNGSILGRVTGGKSTLTANAEILLVNISNQPICCSKSNNSGYYTLSSLSLNTYQVYAEIPGYVSSKAPVTLNQNNQNVNGVIITLTPASIKNIISNNSLIARFFPNPVQDKLMVEADLESDKEILYTIYNSLGVKVDSKLVQMTKGINSIEIETKSWPNGLYFINISSADHTISLTQKIIK